MDERPLYARKGEEVVCENGHHICTIGHDLVLYHEYVRGRDLVNWQQPEPSTGTLAKDSACAICGAPWWKGYMNGDLGVFLHFRDGWRVSW